MAEKEKIAVTIDRQALETAERLRRRTGESRSALVNRALRLLVSHEDHRERVERYIAAYREHPETEEDVATAQALAAAALKGLPWK